MPKQPIATVRVHFDHATKATYCYMGRSLRMPIRTLYVEKDLFDGQPPAELEVTMFEANHHAE